MRAAGIEAIGGEVVAIDLPDPRRLAGDEVLIEVRAAGVGNWDDIVRTGGWDVGTTAPMALGVEASGTVVEVGEEVDEFRQGDQVMTHPLPLRAQGAWAAALVAPAAQLARKPPRVSWESAAAFPVPALTAEQVIVETLKLSAGEQILVHGAGGVTGTMLVSLAVLHGGDVIATAGPSSRSRVEAAGARHVLDYRDEKWVAQVLEITGGSGVPAAVNAARGGASEVIGAVAEGGRLATITSDPPSEERSIAVASVYVRPDGPQLRRLAELLEQHALEPRVGATYSLGEAAGALAAAVAGRAGGAVVLSLR